MRFIGHIGVASLGILALSACSSSETKVAPQAAASRAKAQAASIESTRKANVAVAAKAKANELGQIPVLMYHRVVPKAVGDDRTPQQFRAELDRLAQEGYVPITAAEYVTGKIAIPAGKHPVVLTFDDSSPSQLALDGAGVPKPDTAVGILQDVARRHPGFRPVATFYVIKDMFGAFGREQQAQVLGWLRDNGFDIGNHTRNHLNLRGKSKNEVADEIVAGQQLITNLIQKTPVTLALPYGNQPKKKEWALRGEKAGVSYDYSGVFLAGYDPAFSPFTNDFNPLGIPRIRSMGKVGDCVRFCSTAWLDWLKAHPTDRFTSDGNVNTVAFPKFKAPFVAKRYAEGALPY